MIASREEIAKAEVEAYYKTHYRLDWLLSRTLGYAVLSSTLAIYVFWAEAGRDEHPFAVVLSLSLTWILLLGMAMLWYDFHTRVSYETWPAVRGRITRHLVVSFTSFIAAFLMASVIHGASGLIDRSYTPESTFKDVKGVTPRTIHWRKGLPPDTGAVKAVVPNKKSAAKAAVNVAAGKPAATNKPVTKPNVKVTATPNKTPAVNKAPAVKKVVSKPTPKPVLKKHHLAISPVAHTTYGHHRRRRY